MNQENFALLESFGYHFNLINTTMKQRFEEKIKPYDITAHQFGILLNVYKNNATTQKELGKYINADEPSITRLIDRLSKKELLKRVADSEDKRKKRIVLTESGVKTIETLIPYAQEQNKLLTSGLDQEEKEQLLALLQKITKEF